MYLYVQKEELLVSIENFRATRTNLRNLPNKEIANWIAEQCQLRQKIRQRRSNNIIMYARKEADLQILDHRFRSRLNDATRTITTMQQNEMNAANDNNNNEMDQLSSPPPPEEEPPDKGEAGRKVAIVIEFRSGLDSECHTLSFTH